MTRPEKNKDYRDGEVIWEFRDQYAFLSNFWHGNPFWSHPLGSDLKPISDILVGFRSCEHWFQAHKATNWDQFMSIVLAATAGEAKHRGRRIALRSDWEQVKDQIMRVGLQEKFQNNVLRSRLLATHPKALVEGNNWGDTYWGAVWLEAQSIDEVLIDPYPDLPEILVPSGHHSTWIPLFGHNHLGTMLESLRERLRGG